MIEAIVLYGSKARADGSIDSDTDLLGIARSGKIQKTYDDKGLSFHSYPLQWLIDEAAQGQLFLLHIAIEAVAIFDPMGHLDTVRQSFVYKESYANDVELGLRILYAVAELDESAFHDRIRSRYFWGLRTSLMAWAADERHPAFASESLERLSKIEGLASHIRHRRVASLNECKMFCRKVIEGLALRGAKIAQESNEENIHQLLESGGLPGRAGAEFLYGVE